MSNKSRNTRTYDDLRKALKRKAKLNDLPCWICGKPIDWQAGQYDPMSFNYDHKIPIARGGTERGAGRVSHRLCNITRGKGAAIITPPIDSRDW